MRSPKTPSPNKRNPQSSPNLPSTTRPSIVAATTHKLAVRKASQDNLVTKATRMVWQVSDNTKATAEEATARAMTSTIVVVEILVNPAGKVTRAEIKQKGTTIINSEMRQKAIQAALRSTFAADPNAPDEQKGTITYTFVINK